MKSRNTRSAVSVSSAVTDSAGWWLMPFSQRMKSIPISSNKSMIGHTLTAAGTVEAIFTLLAMRHGRLPPTINYVTPDPALPVDCVPNVARDAQVSHALSNSFGFGGQNVSLVIGLP